MSSSEITENISSPPEIDTLLEELRREANKDRRLKRVANMGCLASVLCVLAIIPFIMWMYSLFSSDHSYTISTILGILFLLILAGYFWEGIGAIYDGINRQKKIERLLIKLHGDTRVVGPLTIMLRQREKSMYRESSITSLLRSSLRAHLWRLKASDRRHMAPSAYEALLGLLQSSDEDLVVAILKALEQIGDGQAIAPVEQVASKWPPPHKIGEAALVCLPFLHSRAEDQEKASTLLRPAESGSTLPEALLRPTGSSVGEEAPEQLLRPSAGDNAMPGA